MKPVQLELKDFMSYRNATIKFEDMLVVVGHNGAGKSTILDGITFALWGQTRARLDDVVRWGAQSCTVRLHFSSSGKHYVVTRRRDRSGSGKTDLEFSYVRNDRVFPLTANTIKMTQATIDGAVGFTYDVFANSSLLQQGDASRFSDARPAERKTLLATMLGLDTFVYLEQKAKGRAKEIGTEVQSIHYGISGMQTEIENLEGAKEELEKTLDAQEKERVSLSLYEKTVSAKSNKLEKERVNRERLSGLESRYNDVSFSLKTKILELEDLILARDKVAELLEREDEIVKNATHYKGLKKCLEQIQAEKDLAAELATLHAEIKAEHDRLEALVKDYPLLVEQEDEASQQIIRLVAEANDWQESIVGTKESLKAGRDLMDSLNNEIDELRDEETRLEQEIATEKSRIEQIDQDRCPLCTQPIPNPEALKGRFVYAIYTFENLLEQARKKKEEKVEKYSDVYATGAEISEQLIEEERGLAALLAKKSALEQRAKELQNKLDELEPMVGIFESESFCLPQRERIAQIGEVEYDSDEYEKCKLNLASVASAPEDLVRLEASKDRFNEICAEIEKKRKDREETSEKLAVLKKELEEVADLCLPERTLANLKQELEIETQMVDRVRAKIEEGTKLVGSLTEKIARRDSLIESIEEQEKRVAALEAQQKIAEVLAQATGKKGAPALIIEAALPEIENDANEYLAHMTANMQLQLRSQREAKTTGNVLETLDIVLYHDATEVPIESLSGGERFRADLALRLAIGRKLARQSGVQIKALLVDEGFGSQDADGQESIIEVIGSLRALFETIVVITHIQNVASSLGVNGIVANVRKGMEGSVIYYD